MGIFYQLKQFLKNVFAPPANDIVSTNSIYAEQTVIEQVHSIWDYISFTAQSQAFHICNVLGFEEWVSMEEILRRIKELFGAEYKNERSLYPYIKTLVDCNLLETSGFGGKKHWRKKELLIKIEEQKQKHSTIIATTASQIGNSKAK